MLRSNTELIITDEGKIYHLRLRKGEIADNIILVGDPDRVSMISNFFEKVELRVSNREIVTHTGLYKGKRVSVVSTGMGPDNIDIVMNELDALVNIDFNKRVPEKEFKSLNLVRLGTSGSLQEDIPVNSVVLSSHGVGLDGLIYFYDNIHRVINHTFTNAFIEHMKWPANLPTPYVVEADPVLLQKLNKGVILGMTATSPGFYGPQGRKIRLGLADPEINNKLQSFNYEGHRITNYEMETSALFGLGRLLGHFMCSMNALVKV